jgi:hypothetical protein
MPLRVVRLGRRISLVLICLGDTALYRRVKSGALCRRDCRHGDVAVTALWMPRLYYSTSRLHLVSTLCYR